MDNPNFSMRFVVIFSAVVLVMLGGMGAYAYMDGANAPLKTIMSKIEPAAGTEGETEGETEFARLTADRYIGDINAPVTIEEFSSKTCGHCGNFHKGAYKELKEKYIKTGKVRMIFRDFPLNAPALHASMIARCLPETRYEKFIQILFENQNDWAYGEEYLTYLRQNAQFAGLSSEGFDKCMKNEELQQLIIDGVKKAQDTHGINSTPTFVINGKAQISGAQGIDAFSQIIDQLLIETGHTPSE